MISSILSIKFNKSIIEFNKKSCEINSILAHSENFKSAKAYLLPYFQPLCAKSFQILSLKFKNI
jgi:hypothetical protein